MRSECLSSAASAVAVISSGSKVGIGGSISAGHPMALIREVLRSDVRELAVVAPTAGLDVDLMIAAGRVSKLTSAYVGAEEVASIGPALRAAAEQGSLELADYDEALFVAGLRAAGQKLPFLPWRGGVGTALPELNPELVEFSDPINGETLIAVPAIDLDVAIVTAEAADRFGNVWFGRSCYMDPLLANAARIVVVQAERVVENDRIRQAPERTRYWSQTIVVEAQYGTHPFAGPLSVRDEDALREYAEAADKMRTGNRGALDRYMDRYIHGCRDHDAYLALIGEGRLSELSIR